MMPKSGSPYRRPSENSTALVQRGAFSSVGAWSLEPNHLETASELCEVPLHCGQLRVLHRWYFKPVRSVAAEQQKPDYDHGLASLSPGGNFLLAGRAQAGTDRPMQFSTHFLTQNPQISCTLTLV